jgi:hypothetical protein
MGESKLREAGNGDEDRPKPVSSHIIEVVDTPIWGEKVGDELSQKMEAAYTRLSDRAKREDSLIVNVIQSVNTYTLNGERAYAMIVLTAQRIGRDDFERQQRIAQMSGGPRR